MIKFPFHRALQTQLAYTYRLRQATRKTQYKAEIDSYKKVLTQDQYRKRNIEEYWESQTKLENDYLDQYLENQRLKAIKQEQKLRDFTIAKTYQDTLNHQKALRRLEKDNTSFKQFVLEENIRKMNRQQLLQMLREQSKSWLNEANVNESINAQVILPEAIIDETDYYLYLQEQALYNEQADFVKLEEMLDSSKSMRWKNKLATEYFQRIVSIVKYLRQADPYQKLLREWSVSRSTLSNSPEEQSRLDDAFQTIVNEFLEQNDISSQLEIMNKQLIQLYNLLELWDKYTQVIKMNAYLAEQMVKREEEEFDLFKKMSKTSTTVEQFVQNDTGELSGDEKYTSSDEEIDLEKLKEQRLQDIKIREQSFTQQQADKESVLGQIQSMIDDSAKLADQEFSKQKELYPFYMYKEPANPNSLYSAVDLEKLFPQRIADEYFTTPPIQYRTYEAIQKSQKAKEEFYNAEPVDDKLAPNPDIKRLQTMVVVEIFKEQLKDVVAHTSRDQTLLQQNRKLLDLIGEMKIDEPQLLLKLWKLHV